MKNEVRLGIVGAGWPGQQHARAIRTIPNAQLTALAEPDESRSHEFGVTYTPKKRYADYAELSGDPAVSELQALGANADL
ncbi:MAG: Gfo/Idh/MocA family oxidoreductase [Chthoniobacterales bacterium]